MPRPWNPPPPQNPSLLSWTRHHPSKEVREAYQAFLPSCVEAVGFPAGTVFSRIMTRGHNSAESPWLGVPEQTQDMILRGSDQGAAHIAQLLRAQYGLQDRFNPSPDMIYLAELTEPRWGLFGRVGPMQPKHRGAKNVVFIGGAAQAWIPAISATGIRFKRMWSATTA